MVSPVTGGDQLHAEQRSRLLIDEELRQSGWRACDASDHPGQATATLQEDSLATTEIGLSAQRTTWAGLQYFRGRHPDETDGLRRHLWL